MKILILDAGGRAHAFCWKIRQSELCTKLFIAPGNAGTSQYGENINIDITDFNLIKKVCITNKIDLVLVGPEEPLVKGIYNFFKNDSKLKDIILTGPSSEGAKLEGSKAFAKAFMKRHNIPTAAHKEFSVDTYDDGLGYIQSHGLPVVLKADGLAGGKGVLICNNY
ncbi:MAG: phosphoribosylamine--glycine ligase, partial [Ginsengibacter sp.]